MSSSRYPLGYRSPEHPGLGQRIRQLRTGLGLTQSQFAQRLGVIQVSVARYEAGRLPRADLLAKIAGLGNVTVEWLLHGPGGSADLLTTTPDSTDASVLRRETGPVSLNSLQSQFTTERVALLPEEYRRRYQRRIRELTKRIRRELDEYAKVLEAEYRAERRRGRHRS